MTGRFDGKTVIVTGASRGIGFAIARRLVDEGARVVITARKEQELNDAVAQLGGSEHAFAVVGRGDDIEHQAAAISVALERFGTLDCLVNNVGTSVFGSLMDADLDDARRITQVNCIAALSWIQHAYRAWMRDNGGAIVNISSIAGLQPSPGIGLYGASKAMLDHLTAGLAVELGPNIRVNGIAPAVVKTQFAAALFEGREDRVSSGYPLKRLGEPEDIAAAAAFLLSRDASWITGRTLVIDGGVTLTAGTNVDGGVSVTSPTQTHNAKKATSDRLSITQGEPYEFPD